MSVAKMDKPKVTFIIFEFRSVAQHLPTKKNKKYIHGKGLSNLYFKEQPDSLHGNMPLLNKF